MLSRRVAFAPSPSFTPSPVLASSRAISPQRPSHLHLRRTRFLRAPLRAAPAPSPRAAPHTPPSAALAALPGALHTAASLCAYGLAQRGAGAALAARAVVFPAPLAAMLVLLAVTLAARRVVVDEEVDAAVGRVFGPGSKLLAKWLAVFFVPNLVMLPLAPRLPGGDLIKIALVVVGGFLGSLVGSVGVSWGIRKGVEKMGMGSAGDGEVKGGSAPPPPSDALIQGLAVACGVSLLAAWAVASGVVGVGGAAALVPGKVYALVLTILTFSIGQRLPKSVKGILHPLVTCTSLTIAGMALLGAVTGTGFNAALAGYYVRSGGGWGGGNVLAFLLGPAVVSFAFQIDARRRLLAERFLEIVGTSLASAAFGLFGSAAAARMLNASPAVRLMLVPRQVTAPLAIPIAGMLGADVAMAATIVAITGLLGANVSRALLTAMGVSDPVMRGLAAGSSAHGLGTAAMNDEPAAFPFAALAMALVGIFSTMLVTAPPARALLLRIALGKLAGGKVA